MLLSSVVLAQPKVPDVSYVPADIKGAASEKDWVELYSLEAKARGGEAVAKVEALAELLPQLLKKTKEFGVEAELPDYQAIIQELEARLETVGQQDTVEAAHAKLHSFIDYAGSLRTKLAGDDLRTKIEGPLKAKGEEIKARLEAELKTEVEKMKAEAEEKITVQAEAEAGQMEIQLRDELTREIESELLAEFNAYRAQVGDDEELLAAYVEMLKQKGPQLGQQRGKARAEQMKAQLQEKYQKLAEQEKAKITEFINQKADEIAGEERKKLEDIRDGFLNLENQIEVLSKEKMARWQALAQKAAQKKKGILLAIIGTRIDEAKSLIMVHKEELDRARAAGKDIASAEELVARLEADKEAMADSLILGDLNDTAIRQAAEAFRQKWENIRIEMERAKERASQEIYATLMQRLEQGGFSKKAIEEINPEKGKFQLGLDEYNNAKEGTPNEELKKDLEKGAEVEKMALTKLKRVLNYSEASSVDSLLAFKEELVSALSEYKAVANTFKTKYPRYEHN